MIMTNEKSNSVLNPVSISGLALAIYSLCLPIENTWRIIGVVACIASLLLQYKGKICVKFQALLVVLFAISFFALDKYMNYSMLLSVTYGLSIIMMYILGYNWSRKWNEISKTFETSMRAITIIYYCVSFYIVACVLMTFITGGSIGALSRNPVNIWGLNTGNSTHFGSLSALPLAIATYRVIGKQMRKRSDLLILFLILLANILMSNRIIIVFFSILTFISIILGNYNRRSKRIQALLAFLIIIVIAYYAYKLNLFGLKSFLISRVPLFRRMELLDAMDYSDPRLERQIYIFTHFFEHMHGGGYFRSMQGDSHNVWLNIYDYAGWVPFLLFTVITLINLKSIFKFYRIQKYHTIYPHLIVLTAALIMAFIEEPIAQSFPPLFVLFFFISGLNAFVRDCATRNAAEM